MYDSRKKKSGMGRGAVVFSISFVALLALGIGLIQILGGGGETQKSPVTKTVAAKQPVKTPEPVKVETVSTPVKAVEPVPVSNTGDSLVKTLDREVTYQEAEAAYTDRNYEEAVVLFMTYTDQHPGNAWGHYMLGLSAWKAGDLEEAEEGFRSAAKLDPKHLKTHRNLARMLLDDGRPGEALVEAQLAVEIDPEDGESYRILGRAHHNLGDVDGAVDAYRSAVALNDKDGWAMNNWGLVLIESGRFEEALYPLAQAVTVKPDELVFQNNLGIALERTGHFNEAADAFRAALVIDDTSEKVLANLDRVEGRTNTSGPVDLDLLASEFLEDVNGVKEEPMVIVTRPETVTPSEN